MFVLRPLFLYTLLACGAAGLETFKLSWLRSDDAESFLECPSADQEMLFAERPSQNDNDLQPLDAHREGARFFVTRNGTFVGRNGIFVCRKAGRRTRVFNVTLLPDDAGRIFTKGTERQTIVVDPCSSMPPFRHFSALCNEMRNTSGLNCSWMKENDTYKETVCVNPRLEFRQFMQKDEGLYRLRASRPGIHQGIEAAIIITMDRSIPITRSFCQCEEQGKASLCKAELCPFTEDVYVRECSRSWSSKAEGKTEKDQVLNGTKLKCRGLRIKAWFHRTTFIFSATPRASFRHFGVVLYDTGCVGAANQLVSVNCSLTFDASRRAFDTTTIVVIVCLGLLLTSAVAASSQNLWRATLFLFRALHWRCGRRKKISQPSIFILHMPATRDKGVAQRLKDHVMRVWPDCRCHTFYDYPDNTLAGEDAFSGRCQMLRRADMYVILGNGQEWPADVQEGLYHCRKHLYRCPCVVAPVSSAAVATPVEAPLCCLSWLSSDMMTVLEWPGGEDQLIAEVTRAILKLFDREIMTC